MTVEAEPRFPVRFRIGVPPKDWAAGSITYELDPTGIEARTGRR